MMPYPRRATPHPTSGPKHQVLLSLPPAESGGLGGPLSRPGGGKEGWCPWRLGQIRDEGR